MTQRLWSNDRQTPQPPCPRPFVTGSKMPPQSCILHWPHLYESACGPWCFFNGCSCCSYPSVYHSSLDLPFSSSPQGTLLPFKDHSDTFLGIFGSLSFLLQLPRREELPTPLFCGPKVPSTEGKSISLMLVCGYFSKTPAHTQCNHHR